MLFDLPPPRTTPTPTIESLPISRLVVTNTLPQSANLKRAGEKMDIVDVSGTIAESIRRTHNGESFSILFGEGAGDL